jgi:predicted O-methyltransferase YrrM
MGEADAIPQRFPTDIWPGLESITAQVRMGRSGFELPPAERLVLDAVVRFKAPRAIFELGTWTGSSTALLADAAPPGAVVHTVDLPEELFAGKSGWWGPDGAGMVGREFNGKPEYADRIVQHRADLASFDVAPFRSEVDVVFVDDGHSYEDVHRDSEIALQMVRPGGCIIWDDYAAPHAESVRALNELAEQIPLVHIAGTRFVAYQQ